MISDEKRNSFYSPEYSIMMSYRVGTGKFSGFHRLPHGFLWSESWKPVVLGAERAIRVDLTGPNLPFVPENRIFHQHFRPACTRVIVLFYRMLSRALCFGETPAHTCTMYTRQYTTRFGRSLSLSLSVSHTHSISLPFSLSYPYYPNDVLAAAYVTPFGLRINITRSVRL